MTIRRANIHDLDMTYAWATDDLVRANSFSSDNISFEGHSKWFTNKLGQKNAYFYILEDDVRPCGLVRIEEGEEYAVVGITVGPESRGKGYSSSMLQMALVDFRESSSQKVYAYIKKENVASIKAFERAGFSFDSNLIFQGAESKLYIWK